jgi:hypothetical protein
MLDPLKAVIPITSTKILSGSTVEENAGLAEWWLQAEKAWNQNKAAGDSSSLLERLDYHGQLSAQLPAARHRVVYSKAGNTLAAARIDDSETLIDHMLYWAAASSLEEARFLTVVLNSSVVLERVKPLQALGLFGARHFDKAVFSAPIPVYDSRDENHLRLVDLAVEAEDVAERCDLSNVRDFKIARRVIRDSIAGCGLAARIEQVVARVIPEVQLKA